MDNRAAEDAVNCSLCKQANSEGSVYCQACGALLTAVCPGCGREVGRESRFCPSCGRPLPRADLPRAYTPKHLGDKILASRAALEGERKQVTVMFADVVESMRLAGQVDAEDWRLVMQRLLSILCEGVHRFEGTVNQFTGDGILALFGAPLAHEDHARRACHATLYLREALARYAAELRRERDLDLAVRIGVNSGEVVIGAVGDDLNVDYAAIGNTVSLAARMEKLAEPGTVCVTAATAALVEGYFDLRDLGAFDVKGIENPVRVFELAGLGSARTRVEAVREQGLSRFVGRDQELAALEAALDRAQQQGAGQIVGIVADPGLGKSRLCYEFAERCRERGLEVNEGYGVAHGKRIPLLPMLEMMRAYFAIEDGDSERGARDKIATRLLLLDDGFNEFLPVLFDFLGVSDPERPPPINPEARERQLLAAVRRWAELGGQRNRRVILIEDLHWLDPGSEVFIANVIAGLAHTQTLLIASFRPGYEAPWMRRSSSQQISLSPLGREATSELLADLLGADLSCNGLGELIQERTEGNPFYIEEVVQGLIEAGSLAGTKGAYRAVQSIEEITIPPTVQAALAARIDRLGELHKGVLQTAAVIGREFSESVLRRVVEVPEPELGESLRALTEGEFLYERSLYPDAEYSFKHPLTEEVAYRSQLTARRRRIHAAVAGAIPEANPERSDELAALIASHWERAGEALEAARWNVRAAKWAGEKHPSDALRHWVTVRSLVSALPDSPEVAGLRFGACASILLFGFRMGMSEREIAEAYLDGRSAAEQLGDPRLVGAVVVAYGTARGFMGHAEEAVPFVEEARAIAERCGDKELLAGAQMFCYFMALSGRLEDAVTEAEALGETSRDDPNLGRATFGMSAYAFSMFMRGWMLADIGRLEEARATEDEAVALARAYEDTELLGWALGVDGRLAWLSGEPGESLTRAREAVEIADRLGSSFSRSMAHFYLAYAHSSRAEWDEAASAAERALEIARETHTGVQHEAQILALLAEARLSLSDQVTARAAAEEALAYARRGKLKVQEIEASVILARALRYEEGASAHSRVAQLLANARRIANQCGARAHLPRDHEELAELALLKGDHDEYERQLEKAQSLFEEIGAHGHAARLATRLAALPAQGGR